ncbi:lyase [Halioglobus sp. HI00S01]|uniref:VOC family protein n=1 Tax=Halioglobus sp. HI00S01 TaxID=1822214 RepID=UPI0007C286A4|nr:VOC family protein [Halioglobus sp. HI00S01]KZX59372.1 lyase [Halioglobus sp. HI00S01]
MSTPNLSWGHININVSNLDASIAFYEKFGFSVLIPGVPYLGIGKDRPSAIPAAQSNALNVAEGTKARACIMQLDNGFPKIDLTEYAKDAPRPAGANDDLGMVRLCLATQDLAADYALLKQAGIEFLSAPTAGVGELADIAICRDPDGTLIELIEIHPSKWSAE